MKKVRFEDLSHEEQVLVKMAEEARKNAYAPYSGYKTGAAVLATNGKIYIGCNVENAIYKVPHAEENAISAMAVAGARRIIALCCIHKVVGMPCGNCRQLMWEFCGNDPSVKFLGVDLKGNIKTWTISELLPEAFGPKDLGVNPEKY